MRSLWSLLIGMGKAPKRQGGNRPEALRRETILMNGIIVLALSGLSLPPALLFLIDGHAVPLALCVIGLTASMLVLVLSRNGQTDRAGATLVTSTLTTGTILTLADPALADFGLGIALLAPVMASLYSRNRVKMLAWMALGVVTVLATAASLGLLPIQLDTTPDITLLAGFGFLATGGTVALAASRLNTAYEAWERAQSTTYRHLIEHAQDAVMRFGADGTVIFASLTSETLFGCRRFELSGNGLVERIHVLDRPSYMTAFADANRDGASRRVEIRMRRDDRETPSAAPSYFWVEADMSPVIDPEADAHEVVVLFRDITSRRDREEELKRTRKQAEEASIAKSRFLATMGHELRTPLSAIVGFSDMMTSGVVGELAPQHREYAKLIHQSGTHLIEVVQMLLDMSRLEAGKFELVTESFAPDSLLAPCLTMVDGMARERAIRLMTDVPRPLPPIVADERACRQILINLVSNAIKFSNEHSVVTVGMKRQGRYLALSVRDHGIGMDEDALSHVGEAFYQANDGLDRRYEGTGLGLSIVKGLVELHQGTLLAESVKGEGTVFTVLLPINGPETKTEETGTVTPLHREPASQHMTTWHDDERKRAL